MIISFYKFGLWFLIHFTIRDNRDLSKRAHFRGIPSLDLTDAQPLFQRGRLDETIAEGALPAVPADVWDGWEWLLQPPWNDGSGRASSDHQTSQGGESFAFIKVMLQVASKIFEPLPIHVPYSNYSRGYSWTFYVDVAAYIVTFAWVYHTDNAFQSWPICPQGRATKEALCRIRAAGPGLPFELMVWILQ